MTIDPKLLEELGWGQELIEEVTRVAAALDATFPTSPGGTVSDLLPGAVAGSALAFRVRGGGASNNAVWVGPVGP
jgi:hypothetical protein